MPKGTIVELLVRVAETGETPLAIRVEMSIEPMDEHDRTLACSGRFTLLALNGQNDPTPVPSLSDQPLGRGGRSPRPRQRLALRDSLRRRAPEGWSRAGPGGTPASLYTDAAGGTADPTQEYPTFARRFAGAESVRSSCQIVRTGRLQRLVNTAAGLGWALLPSTAGFIDPLHSAGSPTR